MTTSDKLREFVIQWGQKGMFDKKLYSDLTALISENYVSREAYNVLKEHYQSALAAKDIERDYIDKYYYPKEFVRWMMRTNIYMSINPRKDKVKQLFNYWKENEQ